jgi:hypothetical protein
MRFVVPQKGKKLRLRGRAVAPASYRLSSSRIEVILE